MYFHSYNGFFFPFLICDTSDIKYLVNKCDFIITVTSLILIIETKNNN